MMDRTQIIVVGALAAFFIVVVTIRSQWKEELDSKYSNCFESLQLTLFLNGSDGASQQLQESWGERIKTVTVVNCQELSDYCNRYNLPALPAVLTQDGSIIPAGAISEVALYTSCVGPEQRRVADGAESNFIGELAMMAPKDKKIYLERFLPHASPELRKRLEFEFADTLQGMVQTEPVSTDGLEGGNSGQGVGQ